MPYDCIIVGAGPAGSSALRGLAQLGVNACAVDKHAFPRYKPCGGAISALTARQLDFPWEDVIEASLHHVDLAYKYGKPLSLTTDEPFAHFVMRDRFDHKLLEAAMDAGGAFYPEHGVTHIEVKEDYVDVHTTQGVFKARYVIGADGANGVVARSIDLFHHRRGIAMEAEIEAPAAVMQKYQDRVYISYAEPPWGYGWIFPKARKLSVGVGTFSAQREPIKTAFQKFLNKMELADMPMEVYGHPIPTGGADRRLWVPRVLLTGDAAGLNDPLSGEGIAHAVTSGRAAAHHVFEALQNGQTTFEAYQEEITSRVVDELAKAASIAAKLYAFPSAFQWLFTKSPAVVELYFRLIRGEVAYGDITEELSRLFLRFNLFKSPGEDRSITS